MGVKIMGAVFGIGILVVVVGGVAYLIVMDERRPKRSRRASISSGWSEVSHQSVEPVGEQQTDERELERAAKQEFFQQAGRFMGQYEVLYRAAQGRGSRGAGRVLADWEKHLIAVHLSATHRYWDMLIRLQSGDEQRDAAKWYDVLERWGIRRDAIPNGKVEVSETVAERYDFLAGQYGADIHDGDLMEVVAPSWMWNDSVLERGVLRKSD